MHGAAAQVVLRARAAIPVRSEEKTEADAALDLRCGVAAQPAAASMTASAAVYAVRVLDLVREVALRCRAATHNGGAVAGAVQIVYLISLFRLMKMRWPDTKKFGPLKTVLSSVMLAPICTVSRQLHTLG